MRIEGITGGSASQLSGHAQEQYVPARTKTARRQPLAAQPTAPAPQAEQHGPAVVVDVRTRPSGSASHQAAAYSAPASAMAVSAAPVKPAHIDRDGDGWINLNDLPFDYFQIIRRSNLKAMSQPVASDPDG